MSKIVPISFGTSCFLPALNRSCQTHRPPRSYTDSSQGRIWALFSSSSFSISRGGTGSAECFKFSFSSSDSTTLSSPSNGNNFRYRDRNLSAPLFSLFLVFGLFSSSPKFARQPSPVCGLEPPSDFRGVQADCKGDAEVELEAKAEERRVVGLGLEEEQRRRTREQRVGAKEKETSVVSKMSDLLDLEKQFSFYGAYHSNKVNIFIHILFVWPIFFTSLILWAYTPALAPLPLAAGTLPLQEYMVLNWSFFQSALYGLYYMALDKKAGSLGALICFGCWVGANAVAQTLPWSLSWKIVLASQVTCWFFQVFGHQKFEGRAPALLDNLPQAFLMAPFFVLLECLQSVFGYEPYPGFHKKVQKNVDGAIREFRTSKAKKAA